MEMHETFAAFTGRSFLPTEGVRDIQKGGTKILPT